MPTHSETIEIARLPEEVWRLLGERERWLEGYRETRSRSPEYPGPDTHNNHCFHTRMDEEVQARVSRSEAPALLEEDQQAKTFARHLRYRLEPSDGGTRLIVQDEITFRRLAKLVVGSFDRLRRSRSRPSPTAPPRLPLHAPTPVSFGRHVAASCRRLAPNAMRLGATRGWYPLAARGMM